MTGGLSRDLREYVVMLTPPFRDRGPQPALEGDRVGAPILARTSVGAAFWELQSQKSGTVLQHCWGRDHPTLWRAHFQGRVHPFFEHAGFEPFTDQTQDHTVAYPTLEELP
jgi:hypothetical protein